MKKSTNLGKAEKAMKNNNVGIDATEILIVSGSAQDRAILHNRDTVATRFKDRCERLCHHIFIFGGDEA